MMLEIDMLNFAKAKAKPLPGYECELYEVNSLPEELLATMQSINVDRGLKKRVADRTLDLNKTCRVNNGDLTMKAFLWDSETSFDEGRLELEKSINPIIDILARMHYNSYSKLITETTIADLCKCYSVSILLKDDMGLIYRLCST